MDISFKKISIVSVCILFFLFLSLFLSAEDEKGQIIINPQSLKFYAVIGSPESKPQNVSILSQNYQSLSLKNSDKWISFKVIEELKSGRGGKVEVSVDAKDLDAGVYEGDIQITDKQNSIVGKIQVSLILGSKYLSRNCHN